MFYQEGGSATVILLVIILIMLIIMSGVGFVYWQRQKRLRAILGDNS